MNPFAMIGMAAVAALFGMAAAWYFPFVWRWLKSRKQTGEGSTLQMALHTMHTGIMASLENILLAINTRKDDEIAAIEKAVSHLAELPVLIEHLPPIDKAVA